MKRIITLLFAGTVGITSVFSQSLNENFDGSFPPTNWELITGTDDWDGSNAVADHTSGSGSFARYDCYNIDGTTPAGLITPALVVTNGDQTFSFWYNYYLVSGTWGEASELYVDVTTNGGSTWTLGTTNYIAGNHGAGWNQITIDLGNYESQNFIGSTVKVRFRAISDYGSYDIAIDDVTGPTLFVITCPKPTLLSATNETTNSAELSWTTGGASEWIIEYGPSGFTAGTGSSVQTTSNPYTLTGLTGSTDYDFYVRDFCGVGDSSEYSQSGSFTTLCSTTTLPYLEEFDVYLPNCWTEATGDLANPTTFTNPSSSRWTEDGFGNNGTTGAAKINMYQDTDAEWLISPTFDASEILRVEFDVAATEWADVIAATFAADDTLAVVISTDNGATWSLSDTLMVWTAGNEPSPTGDHITIDLQNYTGLIKIGIYAGTVAGSTDIDLFIDNFEVYSTAGLVESKINKTINVIPNPNEGEFTLSMDANDLSSVDLFISNIQGQIVYTKAINTSSAIINEKIDLSSQSKGIYFIQVNSDKGNYTQKVIIK